MAKSDLWIALLVFCFAASAIYALNDAQDASADRLHPDKSSRPVAAGEISPYRARISFAFLSSTSIGLCLVISSPVPLLLSCVSFLLTGGMYALWGRTVPYLDIFLVSFGFLLRIAAGSIAAEVSRPSYWLFLCAFLMALLLSTGKRHSELACLGENATKHRASLERINPNNITSLIWISGIGLAVSYGLYAFFADTRVVSDVWPWATTPIALFLIGYYMKVIFIDHDAERPHLLWFRHKPLFWGLTSYFAIASVLLYFPS